MVVLVALLIWVISLLILNLFMAAGTALIVATILAGIYLVANLR